jgi:hypothetical protein
MFSEALARRFTPAARVTADPAKIFEFPHFPELGRLAFPMHLSSLAGLPEYTALTNAQRWRLALFDAVLLFSRCHAMDRLVARRLDTLASRTSSAQVVDSLRAIAREKRRQAASFARFCRDYGGRVYADHQPLLLRTKEPKSDDLFLLFEVLILEELSVWFCRQVADDSTLWPLPRDLAAHRSQAQAGHLPFLRAAVETAWKAAGAGIDKKLLGQRLRTFVDAQLVLHLDVEVFRDTELRVKHAPPLDPFVLWSFARSSPARKTIREGATRRLRQFFASVGVTI